MKMYIGIDLGGTNVRAGLVTADGLVLNEVKSPSYAQDGPDKVMENLKTLVRTLPDWNKASGMGVGVPGPVDTINGKMVLSTNLPGFAGLPLGATLTEEFGMPAYLDNDANVAGLAEARVGAGKGLPVVFYTTLSTGIGGAVVVNGQTISGKHGFGGEIANMIIDRNREKINYLNIGAVENEASGTAIKRKADAAYGRSFKHTGEVIDLALTGDAKAKKIYDDMVYDLAEMYSLIGCVLDPDMYVIGGGMTKSADKFLPAVVEKYKTLVHKALQDTPFAVARLEEPGVIGAAMLPVSKGC
jgi:glucokinase